jgi:hypothetical protein
MTIGSSDLTSLRVIKEVTWGVTPSAGEDLTQIRYTGESLDANQETTVSKEIRADRMTADLVPVGQSAGGSFDFEMSYNAFDDWIEGAMFSTFAADDNIVGVSGDISSANGTSKFTSTLATKFDGLVVGQWVKVFGFIADNGYYKITAHTDGVGEITVSPAPPSTETPAAAAAEFHTGMIRNGTTQQSYSIEKRFDDTTAVTYQMFAGSVVAGLTQNYAVGDILTGSCEVLSKEATMDETGFTGLVDAASTANDVLNAVTNMKNILIDDVVSTQEYLTLTLDIGNNLRGQKAIGTLGNVGIGTGKLEVTGNISVYFESKSEMDKFNANTAFSLSFRLEDTAGNAYIYTFGKVKYESLSVQAGGENSDLVAEGTWRALLDTGTSSMIQIDRFQATYP